MFSPTLSFITTLLSLWCSSCISNCLTFSKFLMTTTCRVRSKLNLCVCIYITPSVYNHAVVKVQKKKPCLKLKGKNQDGKKTKTTQNTKNKQTTKNTSKDPKTKPKQTKKPLHQNQPEAFQLLWRFNSDFEGLLRNNFEHISQGPAQRGDVLTKSISEQ